MEPDMDVKTMLEGLARHINIDPRTGMPNLHPLLASNDTNFGGPFKEPVYFPEGLSFGETMRMYDVTNSKPTSMSWLCDDTKYVPLKSSDRGLFSSYRQNKPQSVLWELMEYSMPPFFSRRYSIVNIIALMKGTTTCNYLPLLSYYAMFNDTFGLQFLQSVQYHFYVYEKETYKDLGDVFIQQLEEYVKSLKQQLIGCAIVPPNKEDLCISASEFLFEPCIQIQLPWKPIVLRQWLHVALAEIIKVETEILELKLWSLPFEILDISKNLTSLITNLKERILLGFLILNKQIQSYPKYDKTHPDIILDDVVLPSIPILQFILDGSASKIIQYLKCLAWSQSKNLNESYLIQYLNGANVDIYVATLQNHICQFSNPFPVMKHQPTDFLQRLRTNSTLGYNDDLTYKSFVINMTKNKSSIVNQLNPKQRIDLTMKTIREHIISTKKLPSNINMKLIQNTFKNPEIVTQSEQICNMTHNEDTHLIMRSAMTFQEANKLLLDSHKETSATSQIIKLNLQFIHRHALLELIKYCSQYFKVFPIHTQKKVSLSLLASYKKQIQSIQQKVLNQNRESLWSKFPAEWKKPVNIEDNEKPDGFGLKENIAKIFENRIGRIVYNMAVKSFEINSKGGSCFPDWSFVQYILPGIVASYFEECKLQLYNINMLCFINAMVHFYEKSYHTWVQECKLREKVDHKPKTVDQNVLDKLENVLYAGEWVSLNLKIREHTRLHLGFFTMRLIYTTTITGIDQILNYIHDFPLPVTKYVSAKSCINLLLMLNKWWEKTFEITEIMYTIAMDVFKVPKFDINIPNSPQLESLYQTSAILSELETVYRLTSQNHSRNVNLKFQIEDAIEGMKQERYDILHAVVKTSKTASSKELEKFVESKKPLQLKLYIILKKFRKQNGVLKLKFFDKLPLSKTNPEIRKAVEYYDKGDFTELEKMLTLFYSATKTAIMTRICAMCGKVEGGRKFLVCQQCVEQKYPNVNYYCGRRCQEARRSEHRAEHLEFELGLGEFAEMECKK